MLRLKRRVQSRSPKDQRRGTPRKGGKRQSFDEKLRQLVCVRCRWRCHQLIEGTWSLVDVIQLGVVVERDDAQAEFRGFPRGVEKYTSAVQAL